MSEFFPNNQIRKMAARTVGPLSKPVLLFPSRCEDSLLRSPGRRRSDISVDTSLL